MLSFKKIESGKYAAIIKCPTFGERIYDTVEKKHWILPAGISWESEKFGECDSLADWKTDVMACLFETIFPPKN